MVSAFAVIQSIPCIISISQPEPLSSSTLSAQTRASGATPTNPIELSDAADLKEK